MVRYGVGMGVASDLGRITLQPAVELPPRRTSHRAICAGRVVSGAFDGRCPRRGEGARNNPDGTGRVGQ